MHDAEECDTGDVARVRQRMILVLRSMTKASPKLLFMNATRYRAVSARSPKCVRISI